MNSKIKKCGAYVLAGAIVVALAAPALSTTAEAAKIKLNKTKVYLLKGKTVKLKITGTKKKVTWKSSKKKVATVSKKGKVKAKKAGTATITAKVKGKKYKCKIIVETKKQRNARIKKEEAAKKAAAAKEKAKKEAAAKKAAAEKAKKEAAAKKAAAEKAEKEAAKLIQNAKNLRTYVLKNGSKAQYDDVIEYSLTKDVEDEDCAMHRVGVLADPKTNVLTFTWSYTPDAPAETSSFECMIDLTKGTVKTGHFNYKFKGAYDDLEDFSYIGKMTTEFNKKDKGITITSYWYTESDPESDSGDVLDIEVTDAAVLKTHEKKLYAYICDPFNDLDSYLLKDIGFSMKDVGFTNWTPDHKAPLTNDD